MEGDKQSIFKDKQFLIGLTGGIAIVAVLGFLIWIIFNSQQAVTILGSSGNSSADQQIKAVETVPVVNLAINTFELKKDAEICMDNGKPIVYLFSTASCPHCIWIKETFDRMTKEYVASGKIKAYHYDVETGDDLLTAAVESEVPEAASLAYAEFSPEGYIPAFVFGCKYFRIGNGYESEDSLAKEEAEFKAVIEDLLAK
ncbi:MAG: hypothetical protein WCT26_03280 [Candidatus Buchananbacteria bacterium]|jgi:thiol-disulfide isomerase/thioredoxin